MLHTMFFVDEIQKVEVKAGPEKFSGKRNAVSVPTDPTR